MGIFGRDNQKPAFDPAPAGGVAIDPRTRSVGSPELDATPRRAGTLVGPNVFIKGEVSGDEDVLVDGRVAGTIVLKRQLTVGPAGLVEADIKAKNVLIAGKVIGNVTADEKVELVATGSLEGNIHAAKIVIAEGAVFKGAVDMATGRPQAAKREETSGESAERETIAAPRPQRAESFRAARSK